jgi:hypothetical protein
MAASRITLPDLLSSPVGLLVAAMVEDGADALAAQAAELGSPRVQAANVAMLRRAASAIRELAEGGAS